MLLMETMNFREDRTVTKSIDFGTLDIMDALDLAILIEEEAKERYEEFADQMELHHTPEAASFFRFMISNEEKHAQQLSDKRRALFHDAPTRMSREMLWDVEAPEYGEVRAFMSPRQAIEVALQCEVKAHDFFDSALQHVTDAQVRELFKELREEELEHKSLLEEEMAKLPAIPDVNPDDYADEPTAQ